MKNLFRESYLKHNTLAEATRFLANELFKEKGLVIIDGDDASLKRLFVPFVKEELVHQVSFKNVQNTNALLEKEYDIQVNPREINLFYIQNVIIGFKAHTHSKLIQRRRKKYISFGYIFINCQTNKSI